MMRKLSTFLIAVALSLCRSCGARLEAPFRATLGDKSAEARADAEAHRAWPKSMPKEKDLDFPGAIKAAAGQ